MAPDAKAYRLWSDPDYHLIGQVGLASYYVYM